MTKKKNKTKPREKPVQNTESYTAETIDSSEPVYNNCIFNNIDTAFIGDPKMMLAGAKTGHTERMPNVDPEEVKKQMVQYIESITNFSPEIIERVLSQAEEFMRGKYGMDMQ